MSVADEIKKLAELREQGSLTDGEFEKAKAQLLSTQSGSEPPAPNPLPAGAFIILVVGAIMLLGYCKGKSGDDSFKPGEKSCYDTIKQCLLECEESGYDRDWCLKTGGCNRGTTVGGMLCR